MHRRKKGAHCMGIISGKMWDKRSLTPKDLTCIDCQSPLCKAVGCKTCKTCRNSSCKSRRKCSNTVFIPYPTPKDKAAVEAFLCAECRWTTCACGQRMTARMQQRRNKDRNNERYVCITCAQKAVAGSDQKKYKVYKKD